MARHPRALFAASLVLAALALLWPMLEDRIVGPVRRCPYMPDGVRDAEVPASAWSWPAWHAAWKWTWTTNTAPHRSYTLEELRAHDGTDPKKPILLAVGGKVLDVSSGERFYGVGKTYHQFAGTACTRALVISSLDKADINDDLSGLTEEQLKEVEETKKFYYDKYPVVGELVNDAARA